MGLCQELNSGCCHYSLNHWAVRMPDMHQSQAACTEPAVGKCKKKKGLGISRNSRQILFLYRQAAETNMKHLSAVLEAINLRLL